MKILVYKPGQPPEVVETENSLSPLQKIVGGRIETAPISISDPIMSRLDLVVNEEGVLLDLEANCYVSLDYDHGKINGTFFITKIIDGDLVTLSDKEIEHAKTYIELVNSIMNTSFQED